MSSPEYNPFVMKRNSNPFEENVDDDLYLGGENKFGIPPTTIQV